MIPREEPNPTEAKLGPSPRFEAGGPASLKARNDFAVQSRRGPGKTKVLAVNFCARTTQDAVSLRQLAQLADIIEESRDLRFGPAADVPGL
jgi:hypothetical protein